MIPVCSSLHVRYHLHLLTTNFTECPFWSPAQKSVFSTHEPIDLCSHWRSTRVSNTSLQIGRVVGMPLLVSSTEIRIPYSRTHRPVFTLAVDKKKGFQPDRHELTNWTSRKSKGSYVPRDLKKIVHCPLLVQ